VEKNDYSLSIPLYVRKTEAVEAVDTRTAAECIHAWRESSFDMKISFEDLKAMLNKTVGVNNE
jgi:hypothetical protein